VQRVSVLVAPVLRVIDSGVLPNRDHVLLTSRVLGPSPEAMGSEAVAGIEGLTESWAVVPRGDGATVVIDLARHSLQADDQARAGRTELAHHSPDGRPLPVRVTSTARPPPLSSPGPVSVSVLGLVVADLGRAPDRRASAARRARWARAAGPLIQYRLIPQLPTLPSACLSSPCPCSHLRDLYAGPANRRVRFLRWDVARLPGPAAYRYWPVGVVHLLGSGDL
jgi:hypothetical protein